MRIVNSRPNSCKKLHAASTVLRSRRWGLVWLQYSSTWKGRGCSSSLQNVQKKSLKLTWSRNTINLNCSCFERIKQNYWSSIWSFLKICCLIKPPILTSELRFFWLSDVVLPSLRLSAFKKLFNAYHRCAAVDRSIPSAFYCPNCIRVQSWIKSARGHIKVQSACKY